MDRIEKIDGLRKTYNFPSKMYRKTLKKMPKSLDTILEINTSKYYEKENINYLKKNLRLLKEDFKEYTEYTNAVLSGSPSLLLEVRNNLIDFPSFVDKLDFQLNSLDFDLSKFKFKSFWNDIEILFNSEKKVKEFESRTLKIEDSKYNSMLVKHIYCVENKRNQLDNLLKKDSSRIRCILGKIKSYSKALNSFLEFLKNNFVESKYLKDTQRDSESLKEYYKILMEGNKINFEVPDSFKSLEKEIKNSLNFIKKDQKKNKKEILDSLEKFFSYSIQMNIPFLPEFYDIAYDYIQYPSVDEKTMETLNSLFK